MLFESLQKSCIFLISYPLQGGVQVHQQGKCWQKKSQLSELLFLS